MTAKLTFKTINTPNIPEGPLHLMKVTSMKDGETIEREYRLFPYRPQGVKWAGTVYLAENGTGWQIGRCNSGALIAWKTVKISERFAAETYRMRSVPGGYLGDYCKSWSRNINGHTYDFSRVYWNAGNGGVSVTVRRLGETVRQSFTPGPVKMKKG